MQVKGEGLYELRSIDFVKNGWLWQIDDYAYSPEYIPPGDVITP